MTIGGEQPPPYEQTGVEKKWGQMDDAAASLNQSTLFKWTR